MQPVPHAQLQTRRNLHAVLATLISHDPWFRLRLEVCVALCHFAALPPTIYINLVCFTPPCNRIANCLSSRTLSKCHSFKLTEIVREFPCEVRRHVVGNPQSSDTVILEEKDRRFSVSICKSSDERFLIIQFLGKR